MTAGEWYAEIALWTALVMGLLCAGFFTVDLIDEKRELDARWVRRDRLPPAATVTEEPVTSDEDEPVAAGAAPPG